MAKLIICNWKENPATLTEAIKLATASDFPNTVIAAPFPFLGAVRAVAKQAALAAQDVSSEEQGAFTGAVSASQLASVGVTHVVVGHSERRKAGDTDDIVAKKLCAALARGIIPILCVGESRREHEAEKAKEVVERQLEAALSLVAKPYTLTPVIAYEPVWAISTEPGAQPDTPENAVRMIHYIRGVVSKAFPELRPRYLYGGSVTPENAEQFLREPAIGGALVGGASLREADIKKIIATASKY